MSDEGTRAADHADAVLDRLCRAWADASELWDAEVVAPLGYAYRLLCEAAGQDWGRTLDQPEYDAFIRAVLPRGVGS